MKFYNNQVYDLTDTGKRFSFIIQTNNENTFSIIFRLFVREDGETTCEYCWSNRNSFEKISILYVQLSMMVLLDVIMVKVHFNSNSSRSHAIFQIILKNTSNSNDYFRLVFIDLAGSERATDAQNNPKQTRREGAQINSSLLALKECIRSMDMTHTHAPFRQSKLTHILRDSLVGSKTRTCLMANVSPAEDCCQCSLNTLQYASRIRDISIRQSSSIDVDE